MNIRKNQSFILKMSAAALVAILLGGCNDLLMERAGREPSQGSALVRVIIDAGNGPAEDQARTAVPADPDFSYTLTFTAEEKTPVVVADAGADITVALENGTWSLIAEGTKEGDKVAESEAVTVTVTAGDGAVQTVPITVYPVVGGPDGSFEYDIGFDGGMGISSALLNLTPLSEGGSVPDPITNLLSQGVGSVSLKPGYYRLQVTVTQTNGVLATRREIVHIYAHTATVKDYHFGSSDFTASKYLAGTVDASGFSAFTPVMVYAYTNENDETDIGSGLVSGNAWGLFIEGIPEMVYLKVKLTKNGTAYYGKFEEITGIPQTGQSDIGLSVRGYTVELAGTISNGTITGVPAGGEALPGETLVLIPSPTDNYWLSDGSLRANGDTIAGPPYTYTMPAMNVEIGAVFLESSSQTAWYVSAVGNDTNDGSSADQSLATVAKALALIKTAYNGGEGWPVSQPVRIIIAGTLTAAGTISNSSGMVEISGANAYPPIELRGLSEGTPGILDANERGRVLYIADNNTVILGNHLTLKRGKISSSYSSSDFSYHSNGGGVYVSSGTFTMNGGEISGNTASGSSSGSSSDFSYHSYGGGVYVSSGTFTMYDGEISGNTASGSGSSSFNSYGGGVYVSTGTFIMYDGEISGNAASISSSSYSESYGGGVNVNSDGTFTMNGGKISGNTASGSSYSYSSSSFNSYGGGVASSGTFTMDGGEISGNTASVNSSSPYSFAFGGGAYSRSIFIFTMNGGEISGNTASDGGGGVYSRTRFTMNGGEISGNTVSGSSDSYSYGGGVSTSGNFTMNGGEISGNTNSGYRAIGGGVWVGEYVTFTMNDGKISDNTVSSSDSDSDSYSSGGGVYNGGTFIMYGGEISGNTVSSSSSDSCGGGVYATNGTTFKKQPDMGSSTSGIIYGYTAGDDKSNKVVDTSGTTYTGRGYAVYFSSSKKRETTVTETQKLDSTLAGVAGGWSE